jgi:hypothetical protein
MHQPIPAGKVLNFREEQYFEPKTEKVYNGIYVDAYVSKGAENVWEMVLDGTLTGFSIGGDEVVAETEFSKDANRNVRKITGYRMHELSLVDNPANQHSNILSIQKSADGEVTAEGSLATISVENVFYCKNDHEPVALVGVEDEKTCIEPGCGAPMKNIGWFESDGSDRAEKVSSVIKNFEADSSEGGENMAKEKDGNVGGVDNVKDVAEDKATHVETAEEVTPKGDPEVVAPEPETEESDTATVVEEDDVSVTGTGAEKVEEAKALPSPEDGEVKENPMTKMFEDLHTKIDDAFDKSVEKVAEVTNQFEKQLGELADKHNDLSTKFSALVEKLDSVEKRFEGIEKSGAFKKSADLGGSEEDSSLQKSNDTIWRGSFFSADSLG